MTARLSLALLATAVALFPHSLRGDCTLTTTGVTPLPDAGPRFYKTFQGGLYPRGGNVRPALHDAAAQALAASVQPLDANGQPNSVSGRIVLLSVGMSNTTQEFASSGTQNFKARAEADPAKNPRLTIVDGAQGGQDARDWLDPNGTPWVTLDARLANSGVTAQQVQVVWMKHARRQPNSLGAFPAHALVFRDDLATIARTLRSRFPNLKLLYLSSRTRAYTNVATALSPEPFAFESGFSVKWLIEDQIAGRGNLNWDPAAGDAVAPFMLWGPYLWADGTVPRSDGFTWLCSDLNADYTHPSPAGGVPKVASQLLAFFKTDATATPWFLRSNAVGQPPVVNASASVTSGGVPLQVQFSASATDPDGSVTGYQWTFGDGTFAPVQNPVKNFTAPGTYPVRLSVSDNSGHVTQRELTIDVRLGFDRWREVYFTTDELANLAISGPLADAESDGLTNLAEYELGTNPKAADGAIVTANVLDNGLTMTFPRAKYANSASVAVEAAEQLAGPWQTGLTTEEVIADDGIVETIAAASSAKGGATRYMRLRISGAAARSK